MLKTCSAQVSSSDYIVQDPSQEMVLSTVGSSFMANNAIKIITVGIPLYGFSQTVSNVPNYPLPVLIIFFFFYYRVDLYLKARCSDGNVLPVADISRACKALAMPLMSTGNWMLCL